MTLHAALGAKILSDRINEGHNWHILCSTLALQQRPFETPKVGEITHLYHCHPHLRFMFRFPLFGAWPGLQTGINHADGSIDRRARVVIIP